jgi:hypothetical protein
MATLKFECNFGPPVTVRPSLQTIAAFSGATVQFVAPVGSHTVTETAQSGDPASRPSQAVYVSTSATTSNRENNAGYCAVHKTLTDMRKAPVGGQWSVEPQVFNASVQVLDILMHCAAPEPRVISHGPKSVVFSWEGGGQSLYLTVTGQSVGMLLSNSDGILMKRRLPQPTIEPTRSVFAALTYTPLLASK